MRLDASMAARRREDAGDAVGVEGEADAVERLEGAQVWGYAKVDLPVVTVASIK